MDSLKNVASRSHHRLTELDSRGASPTPISQVIWMCSQLWESLISKASTTLPSSMIWELIPPCSVASLSQMRAHSRMEEKPLARLSGPQDYKAGGLPRRKRHRLALPQPQKHGHFLQGLRRRSVSHRRRTLLKRDRGGGNHSLWSPDYINS